jgi:hypothetical protein
MSKELTARGLHHPWMERRYLMPQIMQEGRYGAYAEAIRQRVCAVCLDSADDGSCGFTKDRVCAIERHLPLLVDTLVSVKSGRMDEYVAALESQICGNCREQDADARCRLRDHRECALAMYLPLVVDAIEEVA